MGIRSGREFIEGLHSPREVYVNGERVADVTRHEAFRRPIESIARLYDMKSDPAYRDKLTYVSPSTGALVDMSFLIPKSYEDLVRKREAYRIFAKATYGMMGRAPEFMNALLAGLHESADWFGTWGSQFADNVRNYYEHIREHDLFLTHALGTPQIDRSKPSHQQRDEFLHLGVKAETSEGLILRGAKQLATMGPLTDELLVFPNGRQFTQGDERYSLAFAIPVSTPGLKFLCREPLVPTDQRNLYDHPLSARFEEIDCLVVFDDVSLPWDRVFFYNNLEAANTMRFETETVAHVEHHSAVRALVKAGLVMATAIRLTDSVKTNVFPQIGERLGNMAAMLKATEALIHQAEAAALVNEHGTWRPNPDYLAAHNILYPKFYATMVDLMRHMGAAGLMLTPTAGDFTGPAAEEFNRYFAGAATDGRHRVQIAKLAWDIVGDSFGQRSLHYERFYAGEPMFFAANYVRRVDLAEWMDMVEGLLDEGQTVFDRDGRCD